MTRRRVFVHIGAPKTGTTYLQDRLFLNARSLARHHVHFPTKPLVSPGLFHFRAALDLLDQDWGGRPGHAEGAWDALVRRVRRTKGTVIISHEILAPAPADKVAKLKRDLAGSDDTELHVVYSVRDLGRQVPAAWQESIKQGRKWSYGRFVERIQRGRPWFYSAFDLPAVLGTWSAGLPPERVHVVTVPQGRVSGPDDLWSRFCRVFGIDPAWAPADSERTNASLGVAEAQLLRRLNRRMGRATRREAAYDELVRELLAHQELAGRRSAPVTMPPGLFPWAEEQTRRWVDWVEASGVDVVGDLADLWPVRPPEDQPWIDPDRVRARAQLGAAVDALAAMTREAARRPDPDRQLTGRLRLAATRLRER